MWTWDMKETEVRNVFIRSVPSSKTALQES